MVNDMKKLALSLSLVAFAIAAQATDAKVCTEKDAAKGGCCSKSCEQVKTSTEAKGSCCSDEKAVTKGHVTKSHVLMSPKAAAEVASR